jgi:hypothetical protein
VSFDPLIEKLAAFVRGIGIEVHKVSLSESTFLPGLDIRKWCGPGRRASPALSRRHNGVAVYPHMLRWLR